MNWRSDRRSEATFLVQISNELQIATCNRQLSDLISASIRPSTWREIW